MQNLQTQAALFKSAVYATVELGKMDVWKFSALP